VRKLAFAVSTGVFSTLVADWLLISLVHPRPWLRWLLSVGVGAVAVLAVSWPPKLMPARARATRVASGLGGTNVDAEQIEIRDSGDGDVTVVSDIEAAGDITIRDVKVER